MKIFDRVAHWIGAILVSSLFALLIGFTGWVLNHSNLPPNGGGVWKGIIIPSAVTWLVFMGGFIALAALLRWMRRSGLME
jgi:hypothetical protein